MYHAIHTLILKFISDTRIKSDQNYFPWTR